MIQLVWIFFGAAFTLGACWSAGTLLLSRLRVDLYAEELQLFRFASGAALFSLLVLILAAVNLAREWAFLAAGGALLAFAFRVRDRRVRLPDFPLRWKWFFGAIFVAFASYAFVNALAPEISPDGATYHLGLVAKYLRQHGLGRVTTSIYANLSEGVEMLFLAAFSIGRHSAAVLVEFAFLLLLPLAMIAYGRRFGFPKAAVAAAVMVFCSPVFAISGSSAYNDAAAVFTLFCAYYALRIWDVSRRDGMLVVVGLLAGFCYGIKYTLALAAPAALVFIVWRLRRTAWKPVLIVSLCAGAMIAPWWIKNLVTVGNPLSPFGNRFFPNPYVTQRFEHDYIKLQRAEVPPAQRPLEHTIGGGHSGGLLGVMFLLTPLGLLALRYREGRMLVSAAILFFLPAIANTQTRFLMLAAPFAALSVALALMSTPGALAALTLAAALLSWPTVVSRYCVPYAWRLQSLPWRDALRLVPERESLRQRLDGYSAVELANAKVPPGGRVFSTSTPPEAYSRTEFVVGYESALGQTLTDILYMPITPDWMPTWQLTFSFPRQALRHVRVVQTASTSPGVDIAEAEWSVGDLAFFSGGREVGRASTWKFSAQPNPWDVGMAFDNNAATRWRARAGLRPGMLMEIDLGHATELDSVRLECAHDQYFIRLRLEAQDVAGNWRLLSDAPAARDTAAPANLKAAAMQAMKARGITHLLTHAGDYEAAELQGNAAAWGLTSLGQAGAYRLYVIE